MVKITLPELGEGIQKATVTYWYFKSGDTVKEKDDLLELTTDKAAFNLPSPCAGKLAEVIAAEGQTVKIGEVLGVIEES